MSSPATSCSRRYADSASTYCSRNRLITIASRNDLIPRFSVYQLGRGSDPVIVVGSSFPAVAFSIECVSLGGQIGQKQPKILSETCFWLLSSPASRCSVIAASRQHREGS